MGEAARHLLFKIVSHSFVVIAEKSIRLITAKFNLVDKAGSHLPKKEKGARHED
jgi:hypothetical protein